MNPHTPPRTRYALTVLFIAITLLALVAPAAQAAASSVVPAVLPAWDMTTIIHDRSRLIQFSIVVVLLGIALLWWGHKW